MWRAALAAALFAMAASAEPMIARLQPGQILDLKVERTGGGVLVAAERGVDVLLGRAHASGDDARLRWVAPDEAGALRLRAPQGGSVTVDVRVGRLLSSSHALSSCAAEPGPVEARLCAAITRALRLQSAVAPDARGDRRRGARNATTEGIVARADPDQGSQFGHIFESATGNAAGSVTGGAVGSRIGTTAGSVTASRRGAQSLSRRRGPASADWSPPQPSAVPVVIAPAPEPMVEDIGPDAPLVLPPASNRGTFRRAELLDALRAGPHPRTLGGVGDFLRTALADQHHGEATYKMAPSGFLLISRLAQIGRNAWPLDGDAAWSSDIDWDPFGHGVREFFAALFSAPTGYFRVLIFAVTRQGVSTSGEPIDLDGLERMWQEARGALPVELRRVPLDESYIVELLVYEYEKDAEGGVRQIAPGRFGAAGSYIADTKLSSLIN